MNVAVTLTRTWKDTDRLWHFLDFERRRCPTLRLIMGDAPSDMLALCYALHYAPCGMRFFVETAEWNGPLGKGAGPARNTLLVNMADRLLGFWDLQSNGAYDTLKKGVLKPIPTFVIPPQGDPFRVRSVADLDAARAQGAPQPSLAL